MLFTRRKRMGWISESKNRAFTAGCDELYRRWLVLFGYVLYETDLYHIACDTTQKHRIHSSFSDLFSTRYL